MTAADELGLPPLTPPGTGHAPGYPLEPKSPTRRCTSCGEPLEWDDYAGKYLDHYLYELTLPWTAPPLSMNHRRHWRATAEKTKEIRDAAHVLAKQARIGASPRVAVTLHYRPQSRRVRDAENSTPTLKAACDGLVDAGIVVDDEPRFMVKNMPVLHEASSVSGLKPRLWLVVEPLWPEVSA